MVGFEPSRSRKLSKSELSIAGATSGLVTRVALQPLDVLKIRFQVSVEICFVSIPHTRESFSPTRDPKF